MSARDIFLDLLVCIELGDAAVRFNAARLIALDVIATRAEHGMATRADHHPAAAYAHLESASLAEGASVPTGPFASDPWFWLRTGLTKAPHTVDGSAIYPREPVGARLSEATSSALIASAEAAIGSGPFAAARAVWEARLP